MNIVLLLGNGFDIKMELNTRYGDFYKWYLENEKSEAEEIKFLKKNIEKDIKLWSDLELRLGEYSAEMESDEEAKLVIENLRSNIQRYIDLQDKSFIAKNLSNSEEFINDLFNPGNRLPPRSEQLYEDLRNHNSSGNDLKVVIFNYTYTLEKLIGWEGSPLHFSLNSVGECSLKAIEHIHGYCDEKGRCALGLDNIDQISNEDLKKSRRLMRRYLKPDFNDSFEQNHHIKCQKWIEKANLIFIYGHSLGDSDKSWLEMVGKNLKVNTSSFLIVYFYRNVTLNGNGGPDYQDAIDDDTDKILEKIGCKDRQDIRNRIFVTYSQDLLSIPAGVK